MSALDQQVGGEHHRARVYLSEARSRRTDPVNATMYWRLMSWAANCRLRIIEATRHVAEQPAQRDLF